MTHICVSKLSTIGSDNGLSPERRQAIIWTKAGILLIGTLGTKFNEILIEIHTFSFKNIHLKKSSGKWRPFCLGLNVLTRINPALTWHVDGTDLYMLTWGKVMHLGDVNFHSSGVQLRSMYCMLNDPGNGSILHKICCLFMYKQTVVICDNLTRFSITHSGREKWPTFCR